MIALERALGLIQRVCKVGMVERDARSEEREDGVGSGVRDKLVEGLKYKTMSKVVQEIRATVTNLLRRIELATHGRYLCAQPCKLQSRENGAQPYRHQLA